MFLCQQRAWNSHQWRLSCKEDAWVGKHVQSMRTGTHARVCPTCKEARPYWKGRRSDSPIDTQNGEVDRHGHGSQVTPPQTDEMSLGTLLSKLPAVGNVHASDGVPKRARSRMDRLASKILDELLMAMSAGAGASLLREKALMLNHLYLAILRSGRDQVQDSSCPKDAAAEPDSWK